jgi:Na+/proline symporter
MIAFLVIAFILVALFFGVASISQSYATAKQAEATIETARSLEITSISTLVLTVLVVLLVVAFISLLIAFLHTKSAPKNSERSSNLHIPLSGPNNLNHLLVIFLIEMLQNQMQRNASQLQIHPTDAETSTEDNDLWLLP